MRKELKQQSLETVERERERERISLLNIIEKNNSSRKRGVVSLGIIFIVLAISRKCVRYEERA